MLNKAFPRDIEKLSLRISLSRLMISLLNSFLNPRLYSASKDQQEIVTMRFSSRHSKALANAWFKIISCCLGPLQ